VTLGTPVRAPEDHPFFVALGVFAFFVLWIPGILILAAVLLRFYVEVVAWGWGLFG
jgi:hypothetical protein